MLLALRASSPLGATLAWCCTSRWPPVSSGQLRRAPCTTAASAGLHHKLLSPGLEQWAPGMTTESVAAAGHPPQEQYAIPGPGGVGARRDRKVFQAQHPACRAPDGVGQGARASPCQTPQPHGTRRPSPMAPEAPASCHQTPQPQPHGTRHPALMPPHTPPNTPPHATPPIRAGLRHADEQLRFDRARAADQAPER